MIDRTEWLARVFHRKNGFFLLCMVLLYTLGVGIARYLGTAIDWRSFFLGLAWIFIIVAGVLVLHLFFSRQMDALVWLKDANQEDRILFQRIQNILFVIVASLFTVAAAIAVLMIREEIMDPTLGLVVMISFILAILLIIPPVRLARSGLGEFILAFLFCQIIPAIAFLLQHDDLNRLVSMSTFPLTAFFFAMQIAFQFETYGVDSLQEPASVLTRIGWQSGVRLHNILIIAGYLLIGVAFWMGMAWRLVWPLLVTVVIAVFQVYLLGRVVAGEKPAWRLFQYTAAALFLLTAYFLTYSYWTL